MPLFGRAGRGAGLARPSMVKGSPLAAQVQAAPDALMAAPAPRRGIFGRVGEWARTRDWERIGAALRDDPAILQNLDTGRRQDQMMAQQSLQQKTAAQLALEESLARQEARAADVEYRDRALGQDQSQFEMAQQTARRGQDLDLAAARERIDQAQATQQMRPLRGPDAALMTRTRETAEGQRGLRGLVQEFQALQSQQRTGPGAGINPLNGGILLDRETRGMDALAARMRGLMRPAGSGATSDFEQRIYARGAPSIDNTPEQNAVIIDGIIRATEIADARQFFYEEYAAAYGDLNGAERAFQASPEFAQLAGAVTQNTPSGGNNRQRGGGVTRWTRGPDGRPVPAQ